MPITRGAVRKLRADKRKTQVNLRTKGAVKEALVKARKKTTLASVRSAFSELDKAARKGVIHRNKAARLKSRLAKRLKR